MSCKNILNKFISFYLVYLSFFIEAPVHGPKIGKWKRHFSSSLQEHQTDQAQWFKPIILASWEAEIGRIMVQGQPEQKVCQTSSQPVATHICHPSCARKHKWEDYSAGQPRHKVRFYLKNTQCKKGVA
jgi:hypothetical protein